jgi:hypothetical protein
MRLVNYIIYFNKVSYLTYTKIFEIKKYFKKVLEALINENMIRQTDINYDLQLRGSTSDIHETLDILYP